MHRILLFSQIIILLAVPVNATQLLESSSPSPTLGFPRWKLYMHPLNSSLVWLLSSDNRDQLWHSNDAGETWTAMSDLEPDPYDSIYASRVHPYLDYHASMYGDSSGNLFITHPSPWTISGDNSSDIAYHIVHNPANTSNNIDPFKTIDVDRGIVGRSNIVANDQYFYIFSRTSGDATGNLRYLRYQTDGTYVDTGWVSQTNLTNIRVGSTLYNNEPVVVIWYGVHPVALRYFLWNGNGFDAPSDNLAWVWGDTLGCSNLVTTREYTLDVIGDILHLAWACDNDLIKHAYKRIDISDTWSYDDIYYNTNQDWGLQPIFTHQNNDLYVFFTLQNGNQDDSDIYYRKWNSTNESWGPTIQLTFDGNNNEYPNTVPFVNSDADYIPLAYVSGKSPYYLNYIRVNISAQAPICDNNGTCEASENCDNCPNDCLNVGEVCCGTIAYVGDCCDDGDCSSMDTCVNHVCTAPDPCEDGTCDPDDNCPLLNDTCPDNSCYEPTCLNGCNETALNFGQKDEACFGSNYCNGAGTCVPCRTDIETDCNGIVDGTELLQNINNWFTDVISMGVLLESIKHWKTGMIS